MMTFKQWLEAERGRAAVLADKLDVSQSAVSLAANGDMRIPPSWYSTIIREADGKLSIETLLPPQKGEKEEAAQ